DKYGWRRSRSVCLAPVVPVYCLADLKKKNPVGWQGRSRTDLSGWVARVPIEPYVNDAIVAGHKRPESRRENQPVSDYCLPDRCGQPARLPLAATVRSAPV